MKASQAWSMDIMLGIIIFIGAAFFFYSTFGSKQGSDAEELENDALKVMRGVVSNDPDVSIVTGSEVDIDKLQALLGEDYAQIKQKLRVGSDFCIFLEDEKGNIIYITPGQTGVRSDKINVSNVPC